MYCNNANFDQNLDAITNISTTFIKTTQQEYLFFKRIRFALIKIITFECAHTHRTWDKFDSTSCPYLCVYLSVSRCKNQGWKKEAKKETWTKTETKYGEVNNHWNEKCKHTKWARHQCNLNCDRQFAIFTWQILKKRMNNKWGEKKCKTRSLVQFFSYRHTLPRCIYVVKKRLERHHWVIIFHSHVANIQIYALNIDMYASRDTKIFIMTSLFIWFNIFPVSFRFEKNLRNLSQQFAWLFAYCYLHVMFFSQFANN